MVLTWRVRVRKWFKCWTVASKEKDEIVKETCRALLVADVSNVHQESLFEFVYGFAFIREKASDSIEAKVSHGVGAVS